MDIDPPRVSPRTNVYGITLTLRQASFSVPCENEEVQSTDSAMSPHIVIKLDAGHV